MPQIIGFMHRKVKFNSEKSAAETEIITTTKSQRYATIKSIKHLAVIVKTVKQNFIALREGCEDYGLTENSELQHTLPCGYIMRQVET